jgi:hypothetical protein
VKRCLVGVVSWCDSNRFPERYRAFRKCVKSWEKYIDKNAFTVAIVDNNSSSDVQRFIESSSVFDIKVLLPENTHDVGAYGVLAQITKDNNFKYVWFLENDYQIFRKIDVNELISFLEKYPQCGYIRLQKYEVEKSPKYDKNHKEASGTDQENAVWQKNILTGKPLVLGKPLRGKSNTKFYLTNWHFGIHGGFMETRTWDLLYPDPVGPVPYYYKLEEYMRKRYHQLKLQTGLLDGGAFSMIAPTIYQKAHPVPFINQIKDLIHGRYGGFIEGNIIQYYRKNYKNFAPVEIQLFSNSLGGEELRLLKEVFDSRWLGYGAKSKQFESEFAHIVGARYGLGISSCTAGLFIFFHYILYRTLQVLFHNLVTNSKFL